MLRPVVGDDARGTGALLRSRDRGAVRYGAPVRAEHLKQLTPADSPVITEPVEQAFHGVLADQRSGPVAEPVAAKADAVRRVLVTKPELLEHRVDHRHQRQHVTAVGILSGPLEEHRVQARPSQQLCQRHPGHPGSDH